MESKHTPIPWAALHQFGVNKIIGNARAVALALYYGGSEDREVEANAAFIVAACNSHEKLLAVAEGLVGNFGDVFCAHDGDRAKWEMLQAQARAAIAAGKGS